ncbi:MAG: alpha/beta fold hydrolase [Solirubrobacterales bacterium]|nr:alpha/beta fold hydrolase [Solirubrobacterales bacterium]MBV9536307.1 alpha/beta fold hydrolase [Solirubrobacterales bacterium]
MGRRALIVAIFAAVLAWLPSAASAVPRHRRPIRVGTVLVPPCRASLLAWCTTIKVPYDYFDSAAGTIRLGFQWYPARRRRATGTILAIQGGPGYPTTDYARQYRAVFGPQLLASRNLLLVNLRGTGNSSPFTCKRLQDWTLSNSIAAYTRYTGACGRQLNHTRKLAGRRGYVQASDLYTTANAARDVALLLRRLRTGRVDFYGDSYGTFFGQVFTARFHQLLRSVTLDSAYPVSQKDPFYPATIQTARRAFDLACLRSVACHRAAPGSSWARIGAAARYLRAHAVSGRTRTPRGRLIRYTVGINELIELVNLAGADSGVYRELDPAIRALLRDHDPVPLLRLTRQEINKSATSGPVRQFNAGLYEATSCLDYPQPFSYRSSFAARRRQYAHALASLPPREFSPFTVHEWVTEPQEEFDACLTWPRPQRPDPPITTPPPYAPRSLPVLVLSGDLDSLTTPGQGRRAARDMGPSARWILVHNDTHVNAMDDTFGCASGLVRRFVAAPGRLRQLNASCATRTPEVRVVGSFPKRLSAVTPATAVAGNQAGVTGLRLAAVAAAATGDAVWHWYYGDGVHGWGLRGGTCHFAGPARAMRIRFRRVRWTTDSTVTGRANWNRKAGRISARLTVTGPSGRATVMLSYRDYRLDPVAVIAGSYRGLAIHARLPAP